MSESLDYIYYLYTKLSNYQQPANVKICVLSVFHLNYDLKIENLDIRLTQYLECLNSLAYKIDQLDSISIYKVSHFHFEKGQILYKLEKLPEDYKGLYLQGISPNVIKTHLRHIVGGFSNKQLKRYKIAKEL